MNPIAIIIVLVILVVGYMYWKQSQSTNDGGTGGSPGGGYMGPSPSEIDTAVPGRMYGPGASKIDYVTSWEDCASACNDYAGCVGAGYYVSVPKGSSGEYSCYLYPETALAGQWRSAPVAVGDAVSQSLATVVPLNKGSITSATPGRLVGPEADITYQTDFSSCAATCAAPCIGAGLYKSLPQSGGTGKYSCYTYDTTAGTHVIPPAAAGDVYSTSMYPSFAGS